MKPKEHLFKVVIIILAITVAWLTFKVYMASNTNALPKLQRELAAPIDPSLNMEILKNLSDKIP